MTADRSDRAPGGKPRAAAPMFVRGDLAGAVVAAGPLPGRREIVDLANRLWARRHAFNLARDEAEAALEHAEALLPDPSRRDPCDQRAEKERLGIPALEAAFDRIERRVYGVQDVLLELPPTTANALAARILMEKAVRCILAKSLFTDDPISQPTLEFLRPSLTGLIRAHVDEILDHLDWPAERLQIVCPSPAINEAEAAEDAGDGPPAAERVEERPA